jgi:hypothetical protein
MNQIFAKLNYKEGQTIYVLNSPAEFESALATLPAGIRVKNEIQATDEVEFVLVFANQKDELDGFIRQIAPCLKGDSLLWMAYPKVTSKKYKCDFNRDTSWDLFKPYNMLPVRQVAIDDDWSALRFRKEEFIKNLTRNK